MTKFYRLGWCSVGVVALVCACSGGSDPVSTGPGGSEAGSGGDATSGGAPDASGGTDANTAGTDASGAGTDANTGGADVGAGGVDASAGGAQNPVVDPNACNAIPIDAPEVAATAVPLAPGEVRPQPEGGTIIDGKYFLTAHEAYGVDPKDLVPATYRTVIVIQGAELQLAQIKDGAETRGTLNVTTTDTHFHAATTCPGPGQSLAYDSYTATDDKLVLFDDEKVVTLTLQ